MPGKKPNPGTSKDMRLKENKPAAKKTPAPAKKAASAAKTAQPKFGTPEFKAKFGKK